MASYSPSTDVEDEVKCPICRDYLTDPVTLDCGHNFCQGCIQNCSDKWEEKGAGDLACPVCRAKIQKGNFRPNWDLANISEKFKLRGKELCEKHKERLHLFCRDDKELVCMFCERSPEHESHTVVLKEEVVQEYKNVMDSCLENLLEEREKILVKKAAVKRESEDLLKLIETERQKAANEFRQLRQFLKKQEKRLLNQMEKVEKEIAAKRDQLMDQLSEELSSLQRIIQEMEEKRQQPGSELLRDVRSTLQRYEKRERLGNPVDLPPELKKRISQFCATNPLLQGDMKQFKDTVFLRLAQKANVALDPATAYPRLVLSEDCKSVRWRDEYQHLPNNSERFYSDPAVLGREGFTKGSHYWEVIVGSEEMWAVGVARKSVRRKGCLALSPEGGVWAVGKRGGWYSAFNPPDNPPLSLSNKPKRIRVTLNYDGREVSFFDADTGAHLYTFLGASFSGEMLLPFFWLSGNKTQLRMA
uniref:Tripartite motif-containing protein 10-like n=1 Tax=Podarcis muralis TaxID=64176 RepID=A0A670HLM2_PODMU|nr:tripartite motif-containing protein 10-like [Podarcis muralis]XP_028576202.1 tripartite motif-containing protein 10-like [Podarcis muralis]